MKLIKGFANRVCFQIDEQNMLKEDECVEKSMMRFKEKEEMMKEKVVMMCQECKKETHVDHNEAAHKIFSCLIATSVEKEMIKDLE